MNPKFWEDKNTINRLLFSGTPLVVQGYRAMRQNGIGFIPSLRAFLSFCLVNFFVVDLRFFNIFLFISNDKRSLYRKLRSSMFYSKDWLNDSQFVCLFHLCLKYFLPDIKTYHLVEFAYISFFLSLFNRVGVVIANTGEASLLKSLVGTMRKEELLEHYYASLIKAIKGKYDGNKYMEALDLDSSISDFASYFKKNTTYLRTINPEAYAEVIDNVAKGLEESKNSLMYVIMMREGYVHNEDDVQYNIKRMRGQSSIQAILWVGCLNKIVDEKLVNLLNDKEKIPRISEIIINVSEIIYLIVSFRNYITDLEQADFSSWIVPYTKSKGELSIQSLKEYIDHIKYPEALNNLVKDINYFELKEYLSGLVCTRVTKTMDLLKKEGDSPGDILFVLLLRLITSSEIKRSQVNGMGGVISRNASKYMDFLYDITRLFSSVESFEEICQKVVNALESEFTFNGAVIFLFHDDKKSIYPFTASQTALIQRTLTMLPVNLKEMKINLNETDNLVVKSCLERKPYLHKDYWRFAPKIAVPVAPYIQKFAGISIAVSYPILYKDEVLGALLVSTTHQSFSRDDMYVLEVFSAIAGNAIKNWYLTHELAQKIQSLEESNKFKSELLEIASHELRTPITIIRDSLSMIDDNEQSEYLYYAKMASARQLILINNILNSSMIENSSFMLYKSEVDINSLIKRVVTELLIFTHNKDLSINLELGEDCYTNADPQKISQVLYNLIYNSLKYTKKGTITVSSWREGGNLYVSVKDTGDGIAARDIPNLFKKYERGSEVTSKGTFGSGIGLYISKYIIDAHQGKITVISKAKRGSTFEFSIPC